MQLKWKLQDFSYMEADSNTKDNVKYTIFFENYEGIFRILRGNEILYEDMDLIRCMWFCEFVEEGYIQ